VGSTREFCDEDENKYPQKESPVIARKASDSHPDEIREGEGRRESYHNITPPSLQRENKVVKLFCQGCHIQI